MKHNIKIGQTVYKDYRSTIRECKVTKIGNKYFYLDNDNREPISLEDLMFRDRDYSQCNFRVYLNKQDIENEKEQKLLYSEVRKLIHDELTLEQLRTIKAIISQSNDK